MDMDMVAAFTEWASAYGLVGIFLVATAERFVPILPSTGFLLAIGMGAATGAWSLPTAILASASGSLVGCAVWYFAVGRIGEERSARILIHVARLLGVSRSRLATNKEELTRQSAAVAFSAQLVPTIRLVSPVLAAIMGIRWRTFLSASAAGIGVWNSIFVLLGYRAAIWIDPALVLGISAALCASLIMLCGLGWKLRSMANEISVD